MRRLVVMTSLAMAARAFAQPAPADPAPEPAPAPPPDPRFTPPSLPPNANPPPAKPPKIVVVDEKSSVSVRHEAELVCAAHDPKCDWVGTFSSLEKKSIIRTLLRRGLDVDPEPWGKQIDEVIVENEDVFAENNWLQFFNNFHYTTREHRVRQELTIQAGEVWDQDRVEESARRLHDPLYTSVVALLPVKSAIPGHVKLLVVTRDIWSLRLNTQYTFQQGALTNLSFSLSENNFFGTRDVLAAAVVMDPGAIAVGPLFLDKDFLGKHITLSLRADEILTRQRGKVFDTATNMFVPIPGDSQGLQDATSLHSEGNDATISISKPLWSLASEWGWGVSFAYRNAVARSFTGANGDPYEVYTDPDSGVPFEYRIKTISTTVSGVRQWGTTYKHQVSFGYTVADTKPSVLGNYNAFADPTALALFAQDVFPRTETVSQPYVGYSIFQPRYKTVRNVGTYELAEDVSLGAAASITLAQGLKALGGDFNFTRPTLSLGYIWAWGKDGFIHPSASGTMRLQADAPHGWSSIDNSATAQLRFATPTLDWFRIVVQSEIDTRWHDTNNSYYVIGSDSGLRGYNVNEFRSARSASSRLVTNFIEMRTVPYPVWVFRVGAVAFYEAGGVAESLNHMNLYNDVGFGIRALVPQTSRDLFRFDLAFPLQDAPNNPAFRPHFLAGFQSYF
ncbi:MAG TPA: BamA/TamA family outer membrane protein [Kofleriaceae bacterium]